MSCFSCAEWHVWTQVFGGAFYVVICLVCLLLVIGFVVRCIGIGCSKGISLVAAQPPRVSRDPRIVQYIKLGNQFVHWVGGSSCLGMVIDSERRIIYLRDRQHKCFVEVSLDQDHATSINPVDRRLIECVSVPCSAFYDDQNDRLLVASVPQRPMWCDPNRLVKIEPLSRGTVISTCGTPILEFCFPRLTRIAYDKRRNTMIFLSVDFGLCTSDTQGRVKSITVPDSGAGRRFTLALSMVYFLAIDHERDRLLVVHDIDRRITILSLDDFAVLLDFPTRRSADLGDCVYPCSACVDNLGRIILSNWTDHKLRAFGPDGHEISSFDCYIYPDDRAFPAEPVGVAFDENSGQIIFCTPWDVQVIGANMWLPGTFEWRPERHALAPKAIAAAVETTTMLRSLALHGPLAMLPNELLFEIFRHL